jgi:hypothetical protein
MMFCVDHQYPESALGEPAGGYARTATDRPGGEEAEEVKPWTNETHKSRG